MSSTEFQINTYTTGSQFSSSVTSIDGGFVVTWESYGQDGDSAGIYGQRYDSTGTAAGSEFQIKTYITGDPAPRSVTSLSDGGFVVTWSSSGVYGQRYDSAGNTAGSEFQLSGRNPSVTNLSDGGFIVTYTSYGQDGDSAGIYGQRYDSSGAAAGNEFQINTYTTGSQSDPSVTSLSDGGFVVVWSSNGQDGDQLGVFGQRFDSTGTTAGSEFQINTYTTGDQFQHSVTSLSDGGFVATWNSGEFMMGGSYIYGQRYDSTGSTAGSEFQINTTGGQGGSLDYPSVTGLGHGGFVVTWSDYVQGGDAHEIFGQRFDSTGSKAGSEFQINTYTKSNQINCSVTSLSDGGFVVTWESWGQDGSNNGIYGQRFDANGNMVDRIVQDITVGHTDSSNPRTLFADQSLVFVSSETESTTVAMSSGSLAILSQDLSFTHVELSNSSYDHGISISDVVLQLRDIVGLSTLEGKQKIAADINQDGTVTISDVVSNLRHIVGLDTIEQCALVDSSDELVTSLTSSTIADLTLVQYGDVDLSATFLIA